MKCSKSIALTLVFSALGSAHAFGSGGGDLPDLEALSRLPVYAASRHYLREVDSPASVTVITADDIRTFGYRTLGDLLRSVRGVHIYNDRNYDYLSARGYSRAGDYNAGVSLQIDGMRINDPIYDAGLIGSEFPLDMDLIERVEFIRGPGSAEFGGSALFGVINVITKSGSAIGGTRVTIDAGSEGRFGSSVQFGRRFANGANLLLSASKLNIRGESLEFDPDEAAGFAGGTAHGVDFTRAKRAFAKLDFENLSLSAGFGTRRKGDAPPYFEPYVFGSPQSWSRDSEGFVNLAYHGEVSETSTLLMRAWYGYYDYLGHWPIDDGSGRRIEHSVSRADWGGTELKLETLLGSGLHLVSGIEHQRDMRLDQSDYADQPVEYAYRSSGMATRTSAYVQADYDLATHLTVTGGVRADRTSTSGMNTNPRLGLIYKPSSNTAWKLLYGGGGRSASPYERLWAADGKRPHPEKVRNVELTLEHFLAPRTRAVMSLFGYRVERVVRLAEDPDTGITYYANSGTVRGRGIEFELEHVADGGTHLRASAAYSSVRAEGFERVPNSPHWLVKGNLSQPLPWVGMRLGLEGQWVSRQYSYLGRVPSIGLGNLTLSRPMAGDGWEVSASIYNLFDRKYVDPLPTDSGALTNGEMPQGGRQYRVTVTRKF